MRRILVVVLNHNKKDLVLDCLASLEQHARGGDDIRILVYDNASQDGSQAAIRAGHPDFELVCSDLNLGAIGGRNAAVAHAARSAHSDYIQFLDDDAEITAGSIQLLAEALEADPTLGLACGKTYIGPGSDILMSTGITAKLHLGICRDRGAGEKDTGQYDRDDDVDACGSFAFMVRASIFDALGGFDPVYSPYGWEDVDFCLRARRGGHRVRYVHRAIFAHKGTRMGRRPRAGYERNKARNFLTLLIRHTTPIEKLAAAIFVPLAALRLFTRFVANGDWRMIPAQIGGLAEHLGRRRKK